MFIRHLNHTFTTDFTFEEVEAKISNYLQRGKEDGFPDFYFFFNPLDKRHYIAKRSENIFILYPDLNIPDWGVITGLYKSLMKELLPAVSIAIDGFNPKLTEVHIRIKIPGIINIFFTLFFLFVFYEMIVCFQDENCAISGGKMRPVLYTYFLFHLFFYIEYRRAKKFFTKILTL